jgi:hypothetical protein
LGGVGGRHLVCPLTQDTFEHPVTTPDGQTYKRDAIKRYLQGNSLDPVTKKPLTEDQLSRNYVIDNVLQEHFQDGDAVEVYESAFRLAITPRCAMRPAWVDKADVMSALTGVYKNIFGKKEQVAVLDCYPGVLDALRRASADTMTMLAQDCDDALHAYVFSLEGLAHVFCLVEAVYSIGSSASGGGGGSGSSASSGGGGSGSSASGGGGSGSSASGGGGSGSSASGGGGSGLSASGGGSGSSASGGSGSGWSASGGGGGSGGSGGSSGSGAGSPADDRACVKMLCDKIVRHVLNTATLQLDALKELAAVFVSATGRQVFHECKGTALLIGLLQQDGTPTSILEAACSALATLTRTDSIAEAFVAAGGAAALFGIIRTRAADTQTICMLDAVCQLLLVLVKDGKVAGSLDDDNNNQGISASISVLVRAMFEPSYCYQYSLGESKHATSLLAALLPTVDQADNRLPELLVTIVRGAHKRHARELHRVSLLALRNYADASTTNVIKLKFVRDCFEVLVDGVGRDHTLNENLRHLLRLFYRTSTTTSTSTGLGVHQQAPSCGSYNNDTTAASSSSGAAAASSSGAAAASSSGAAAASSSGASTASSSGAAAASSSGAAAASSSGAAAALSSGASAASSSGASAASSSGAAAASSSGAAAAAASSSGAAAASSSGASAASSSGASAASSSGVSAASSSGASAASSSGASAASSSGASAATTGRTSKRKLTPSTTAPSTKRQSRK